MNSKFHVVTVIVTFVHSVIDNSHSLNRIIVVCIPNGNFQEKYNSIAEDTISLARRNAPRGIAKFFNKLANAFVTEALGTYRHRVAVGKVARIEFAHTSPILTYPRSSAVLHIDCFGKPNQFGISLVFESDAVN